MDFRKLSPDVTAMPQILPEDMAEIAAAGYRGIICNRPDDEGPDQPSFAEIEAAAKAAGIEARYIPVVSGQMTDAHAEAFGAALQDLPGPVLAYCKGGARAASLWSLAQAKTMRPDDILSATSAAGYDMTAIVRQISERDAS